MIRQKAVCPGCRREIAVNGSGGLYPHTYGGNKCGGCADITGRGRGLFSVPTVKRVGFFFAADLTNARYLHRPRLMGAARRPTCETCRCPHPCRTAEALGWGALS